MLEKDIEAPETVSYVDAEQSKLHIQFTMIEVEKENISLMVDENGCHLSAKTEDVEYAATMSFLRPVKPSEVKASYTEGYLLVELPFKEPLSNYVKVPVE